MRVEDGKFYISEAFFSPKWREREVQYTLGNRRIQHYLTTLEDGRIVVLPPSWDVLREQWFHNLEIAAPDQQEGIIAVQVWNKNCFGCHVSEEVKNYDASARRYATKWLDFGTSCERCHGPGHEHVELYDKEGASPADHYGDSRIVVPTKLDNVRNSMVCAQCHSARDVMAVGFEPGDDYFDYFFPLLEYSREPSNDPTWYLDGKTRRFSTNALGIWQSECFLEGKVACTTCHMDPHEPDIEKNEQLRADNLALCVRCHESIGRDFEAHSFHSASQAGCVDCHMPRSVVSIKATMRDHSISIPAPENTARFGIPNACNLCHEDRSPDWTLEKLGTWYPGSTARDKVVRRADTFSAARRREPGAVQKLLALVSDQNEGPIPRANGLGHLGSFDDPRVFPTLVGALSDEHPLVRAMAAQRIGQLEGVDRAKARAALVPAILDSKRTVRMNAVVSLLNLGVQALPGEAAVPFEEARQAHIERGRFHADDAAQQLNLGRFHVLAGDIERAADAFENSFELDAGQPGIKFFMAVSRLGQDKPGEALALLKQVEDEDPFAGPAADLRLRLEAAVRSR